MTPSAAPDDLPNLGLLIKLLKMTTSNTDAEALSAIRKANQQLQKFGGDWEALLRGKVTVIGDPFADMPAPPKREATPPPRTPQRPVPRPTRAPPRAAGATQTFGSAAYASASAAQAAAQAQTTKAAYSARRAATWKPGPSGGKTRSNLFAGSCVKCSNHVAVDDGFSMKDTSWNTNSKWQVCCHSCFYAGAPAGFTAAKATVTNIDLDSLA